MNFYQAFSLGILQGLTEFLPVSSSGHLVIAQKLLKLSEPPVLFDILVHLGTLLAIIFYLNRKIIDFVRKIENWKLIIVGSIPAALAGFFLNQYLSLIFNSLFNVAFAFLITAGLLWSTRVFRKRNKNFNQFTLKDALIIGCFQSLALLPGVSRSGSTIVAGLWRGLRRETAFLFSFYLAIPAILGAVILRFPDLLFKGNQLNMGLAGSIAAFFSGLLSLKLLEKLVLKGKLFYFGIYCFLLALAIFWLTSISS